MNKTLKIESLGNKKEIIIIPLEEYKELLIAKGKYEGLKEILPIVRLGDK